MDKEKEGYVNLCNYKENVYDSSALSVFMACPMKFYWKYVKKVTWKDKPAPLLFGSYMHDALFEWYGSRDLDKALKVFDDMPKLTGEDKRTKKRGKLILRKYVERYKEEPYEIRDKEIEFYVEIGDRICSGKMDMIIDWSGITYVKDHKTTSSLGLSFFKRFRPNLQMTCYSYACRELVGSCGGAVINGILVAKTKMDFARNITSRTKEELDLFPTNFTLVTNEIERCLDKGEWPRHTSNCHALYFSACPYVDLCSYGEDALIGDDRLTIEGDE